MDRIEMTRQEEMSGMQHVTFNEATRLMNEAIDRHVPTSCRHTVTFGHEEYTPAYSDSTYSHFYIYWRSLETDEEYENRKKADATRQTATEKREREVLAQLMAKYGKTA